MAFICHSDFILQMYVRYEISVIRCVLVDCPQTSSPQTTGNCYGLPDFSLGSPVWLLEMFSYMCLVHHIILVWATWILEPVARVGYQG